VVVLSHGAEGQITSSRCIGLCVLFGGCGICGKLSQDVSSVHGEIVGSGAIHREVESLAALPNGQQFSFKAKGAFLSVLRVERQQICPVGIHQDAVLNCPAQVVVVALL
jgi:hypothetical protein